MNVISNKFYSHLPCYYQLDKLQLKYMVENHILFPVLRQQSHSQYFSKNKTIRFHKALLFEGGQYIQTIYKCVLFYRVLLLTKELCGAAQEKSNAAMKETTTKSFIMMCMYRC